MTNEELELLKSELTDDEIDFVITMIDDLSKSITNRAADAGIPSKRFLLLVSVIGIKLASDFTKVFSEISEHEIKLKNLEEATRVIHSM